MIATGLDIAGDLDNNGQHYFIQYMEKISPQYSDKSGIIIRNENYDVVSQNNFQGNIRYTVFQDWDGDGHNDVWVLFERNDSCYVRIVNRQGAELKTAFLFQGFPRRPMEKNTNGWEK